jgi:hypothetical protein
MFDFSNIHSVAAALSQEGFRIVRVPGSNRPEFYIYGNGVTIATCDSDFHCRMEQLPRGAAATIERYLQLAAER